MGMTFEERIRTVIGEAVREELRAAMAERRPATEAEYLAVAQVAAIALVPSETVHAWLLEGRIPMRSVGRKRRILRQELDAFLRTVGDGA